MTRAPSGKGPVLLVDHRNLDFVDEIFHVLGLDTSFEVVLHAVFVTCVGVDYEPVARKTAQLRAEFFLELGYLGGSVLFCWSFFLGVCVIGIHVRNEGLEGFVNRCGCLFGFVDCSFFSCLHLIAGGFNELVFDLVINLRFEFLVGHCGSCFL